MKLFTILFCFACSQVHAQMPDYFVYLVKGEATAQKGNTKPVRLKQHQLLFSSEIIELKKDAELTLSNKEAKYLVLNKPGKYKISSLSKLLSRNVDNVTKKYLNLLYHELLDPAHDYNKFKKENLGGVWGGVSRGECDNLIFPVKGMKTAEKNLLFKWRKTSSANSYNLKIYNSEAKELASVNINDTVQNIDLTKYISKPEGKYYWLVQSEEGSCEEEIPMLFELISKEEEKKITLELEKNKIRADHKLNIIDRLEKAGLITTAQNYFRSFVSNNKDNATLLKTYAWFLLRYGLEEEAAEVWNSLIDKKALKN